MYIKKWSCFLWQTVVDKNLPIKCSNSSELNIYRINIQSVQMQINDPRYLFPLEPLPFLSLTTAYSNLTLLWEDYRLFCILFHFSLIFKHFNQIILSGCWVGLGWVELSQIGFEALKNLSNDRVLPPGGNLVFFRQNQMEFLIYSWFPHRITRRFWWIMQKQSQLRQSPFCIPTLSVQYFPKRNLHICPLILLNLK